jgi:hypothetical protein
MLIGDDSTVAFWIIRDFVLLTDLWQKMEDLLRTIWPTYARMLAMLEPLPDHLDIAERFVGIRKYIHHLILDVYPVNVFAKFRETWVLQ